MDTVSKLPFILKINDLDLKHFSTTEEEIYSEEFSTIKIVENEEVTIFFNSADKSARLYLDALDILPDGNNVMVDEEGRIFRPASNTDFPLYRHGDDYDALRVDAFRLCVLCEGRKYFSLLEVLPKQLSICEWTMMRDDLENEIRGLAQDIVWRNIGLGSEKDGAIPPQKLYTFFVMQKYASKVLPALIALQNAPKYEITTSYVEEDSSRAVRMDAVTVRRYLHRGSSEAKYSVPVKQLSFDIQENRLLKRIVAIYDHELAQFILTIEGIVEYRKHSKMREHKQYQILYEQGLNEFLDTARKLRKITAIIKTQDWYQTVGPLRDGAIPHAFALDSRYGILYKMYEDLRNPSFKIQLDPRYSYSWKKSSSLYEMWCYIKICRAFAAKYDILGNRWNLRYESGLLFPYLANGVTMSFEDEKIQIDVIFDQFVPSKPSQSKLHAHPFYTVGKHKRPDITIDIYTRKDDWYIGSIILECKYRKLSSFWSDNPDWSSKSQIQSYYTDAKSDLAYGGLGGILDARPVQAVIVLTPDLMGDGKCAPNINTRIKVLKPDAADESLSSIMQIIEEKIDDRIRKCDMINRKWLNREESAVMR